jgi:excisionase family DNA binding protein
MSPTLLKLSQVAENLACTLACVRRWRREGRIAVVKIGRLVRVQEAEVERIVKEGLRPAPGRRR